MIQKLSNITNNFLSSGHVVLTMFEEYEECQPCFQVLISSKLLDTISALVFFLPKSITLPFLQGLRCRWHIPGKIREAALMMEKQELVFYIAHVTPT